jgi:hypothetical protein
MRMMTIARNCQHGGSFKRLDTKHQQWHEVRSENTRSCELSRKSNIGHQFIDFVRLAAVVVARLTEVVGGAELEVVGSGEEEEEEGGGVDEEDVVSGDDVCDEDVRGWAVEEVVGLGEEEVEEAKSEEESEEDTTGVVEEEKIADEVVCSRREELLDVVEVLTLTLEEVEVETAVLLAWLLEPPPAVPEGVLPRAMYPYKPESAFPQLLLGYPGQSWLQSPVDPWSAGM